MTISIFMRVGYCFLCVRWITSFETGTHKDSLLGLLVTEVDDGSEETSDGVNDSFHHQYVAAYNLHSVHIHLPQVTSILLGSGY